MQPTKIGERSQQLDAGSHAPFPFGALTVPIAARIREEGVSSCRDWIDLGAKRKTIFGVISRQVAAIDELVIEMMRQASPPG